MNISRKKVVLSLIGLLVICGIVVAVVLLTSNSSDKSPGGQTAKGASSINVKYSTAVDFQALPGYINKKISLKGTISGVNGNYYISSGQPTASNSIQIDFTKSGLSKQQITAHSNNLKTYTVTGTLTAATVSGRTTIVLDAQSIK